MRISSAGVRLSSAAALLAAGLASPAAAQDWPASFRVRPDAEAAPESASLVSRVAEGYTVRSLAGPSESSLSPELARFLLDRPDLAAFIVARRGIAPYRVERISPRRWRVDDGDRTSGVVDLVSRDVTERIYYADGEHDARLFPTLRASAVVAMTLEPRQDPDCRLHARIGFRVYVRTRSRVVGGLLKALRPFLQTTVARKFDKAFAVADELGRLMARDPDGVAGDARAFGGLSGAEHAELARLTAALSRPPSCPRTATRSIR